SRVSDELFHFLDSLTLTDLLRHHLNQAKALIGWKNLLRIEGEDKVTRPSRRTTMVSSNQIEHINR
ncbi:MAG: hypothetical protein IJ190_00785, partial [Prevotella sp.]|nr:hypothetical protein [Prevotella sp.]